ncbi:Anti-sigma regulatory factor (Ser/Thr protein kinase) [Streptomyces sp. Ag109_G2-15]|nr:Anti-sigma regulatory factor (Ser/Thr protein kinase) [Streptomyces sp. Ag109_G2-15]
MRKGRCTARCFAAAFTPTETRVSQMREITATHMPLWGVPGQLATDIVLVVSELVTNAIQHGKGDVELRVRYVGSEVRIEVTDGNPTPAEVRIPDADEESGRGLLLVAALSRKWGVSDGGTTTWCTFRVPQASRVPGTTTRPNHTTADAGRR